MTIEIATRLGILRGFQSALGFAAPVHGLITEKTRHRVSPIENIAEAAYILASGDPKTLTGRVLNAAPFLDEMGVKPSALV